MSEWRKCKLGDICEVFTGYPFKGEKYELSGNLRVVRGENVTIGSLRWDSEKHWNHSLDGLEQYFLNSNDIVIGMDGSRVGQNRAKIRVIELPLILAQRVARLRAKIEIDQCFLWYLIFDNRFKEYVDAIHTGTSIPHISTRQIADFEITCPPLPEQKAIAAVLSSLDDKIDLLHRQNLTLETMAGTLFRQWFVVEAREDWEEGCLSDIASFHNGKKRLDDIGGGNIPIYGGNGILGYSDNFNYEGTTVIIGRVGAYCGSLYIEHNPVWISDNALVAKPIKNKHSSFLFFLLKYLSLNEMAEGSSHPLLTQTLLKSIPIFLPPTELIESFVFQVDIWLNKINFNNNQIQTLETLRDTLLPKLMSCEVRVKLTPEETHHASLL